MATQAQSHITVRHYECDPLGHVNHAVYLHYFETGRIEAMATAGLPFPELMRQGYTVVAVDVFVRYKAPALPDDRLRISSCITHFHGAVMTWQQEMFRSSTQELLALAEVNGAFTRADGRPTRIPHHLRQLLEAVYVPEARWSPAAPERSSATRH